MTSSDVSEVAAKKKKVDRRKSSGIWQTTRQQPWDSLTQSSSSSSSLVIGFMECFVSGLSSCCVLRRGKEKGPSYPQKITLRTRWNNGDDLWRSCVCLWVRAKRECVIDVNEGRSEWMADWLTWVWMRFAWRPIYSSTGFPWSTELTWSDLQ